MIEVSDMQALSAAPATSALPWKIRSTRHTTAVSASSKNPDGNRIWLHERLDKSLLSVLALGKESIAKDARIMARRCIESRPGCRIRSR